VSLYIVPHLLSIHQTLHIPTYYIRGLGFPPNSHSHHPPPTAAARAAGHPQPPPGGSTFPPGGGPCHTCLPPPCLPSLLSQLGATPPTSRPPPRSGCPSSWQTRHPLARVPFTSAGSHPAARLGPDRAQRGRPSPATARSRPSHSHWRGRATPGAPLSRPCCRQRLARRHRLRHVGSAHSLHVVAPPLLCSDARLPPACRGSRRQRAVAARRSSRTSLDARTLGQRPSMRASSDAPSLGRVASPCSRRPRYAPPLAPPLQAALASPLVVSWPQTRRLPVLPAAPIRRRSTPAAEGPRGRAAAVGPSAAQTPASASLPMQPLVIALATS
jgi:hypothetical protein